MSSADTSKRYAALSRRSRVLKYLAVLVGLCALAYSWLVLTHSPSLARDWSPDQILLAHAEVDGTRVRITNIRNIEYRSKSDYDVHYYDKTFDLNDVESMWFVVEPFAGHGAGAAHTLVSFGFADGSYLAISPEIRKEKGELFSALNGLFRQYELAYVVADEHDVIGLRANHRKDDVYLYPIQMEREDIRAIFVSMLERANTLAEKPEFYNTLTNTCATNMVAHVNEVVPNRLPSWSLKILMPAYFDELMRGHGLIDKRLSIAELRAKYRINDKASQYANDPRFSARIREGI